MILVMLSARWNYHLGRQLFISYNFGETMLKCKLNYIIPWAKLWKFATAQTILGVLSARWNYRLDSQLFISLEVRDGVIRLCLSKRPKKATARFESPINILFSLKWRRLVKKILNVYVRLFFTSLGWSWDLLTSIAPPDAWMTNIRRCDF
jgi:hypothetical protein